MKISIKDERNDLEDVFHYETGIEAFVSYLNEEKIRFIQLYISLVNKMELRQS